MEREKRKGKSGRYPVVTQAVIDKLEQSYSLGCSDAEACLFAGIAEATLYRYQEKHPEFTKRKKLLREKMVLKARTVIADALKNKDKDIAKWYLERKKKDEFSTKQEVGGLIGVVAPDKPNLDEIRKLKDLLENDD